MSSCRSWRSARAIAPGLPSPIGLPSHSTIGATLTELPISRMRNRAPAPRSGRSRAESRRARFVAGHARQVRGSGSGPRIAYPFARAGDASLHPSDPVSHDLSRRRLVHAPVGCRGTPSAPSSESSTTSNREDGRSFRCTYRRFPQTPRTPQTNGVSASACVPRTGRRFAWASDSILIHRARGACPLCVMKEVIRDGAIVQEVERPWLRRWYSQPQFRRLLHEAGFGSPRVLGEDGNPAHDDAPAFVFIASRPPVSA